MRARGDRAAPRFEERRLLLRRYQFTLGKSRLLVWGLVVGLLVAGCGGGGEEARGPRAGQEGALAPDFTLPTLNGGEKSLSDFRGRVVLINFWATWCAPCREEMPDLQALWETYRDKGFEVLGVSVMEDSWGDVGAFVEEVGVKYPILLGKPEAGVDKIIRGYGGLFGLPTSFLLDRKGRIIHKYIGFREREVYERDVRSALGLNGNE